jgi:hypothetical protein
MSGDLVPTPDPFDKIRERQRRLLEQLTDSKVTAIDFDNEIISDHTKYASWLAAIALGGVAAVATHFYDLVIHSYLIGWVARLVIVIGIAILFESVAVAAFLTLKSNQELSTARQIKTFCLKQRLRLLCDDDVTEDELVVYADKVLAGEYLGADSRKQFEELRATARSYPSQDRLILSQQILTAVGYLVVLLPSVPFV